MEPYKICTFCKDPTKHTDTCSKCKCNFYCSRECQRRDWFRHKDNCVSYKDVKDIYENTDFTGFKKDKPFNTRYFLDYILKKSGQAQIWYYDDRPSVFNDIIVKRYLEDPTHFHLWKKIVENIHWKIYMKSKMLTAFLRTDIKSFNMNFSSNLQKFSVLVYELGVKTLKIVEMDGDSIGTINEFLSRNIKIPKIIFYEEYKGESKKLYKELCGEVQIIETMKKRDFLNIVTNEVSKLKPNYSNAEDVKTNLRNIFGNK